VPSGFVDLDKLLGGLHKSDLIILAGRPSMGKTALATNMAFNAASRVEDSETGRHHVVGLFSMEMSAEQLATRILAEQTGIPSERIRRGELADSDFERMVVSAQQLERLHLFIDDTPALSVQALRTRARRLKRQHGLSMLVIDYLQLMRGSTSRSENRVQEISEITRGLKAIAKELNLPVIALSQLSRAVESREDKRPQLADLRESGSIEQDADVVMFVFREEYYLSRAEPMQRPEESTEKWQERHDAWKARCEQVYSLGEVIVAKQRHGPIGKVTLRFEGETTRFSDYIAEDHLPQSHF
jgi:replicative DNA helicase